MGTALGGLCGSDVFQQLKNKYGQQFIKLIIAQKAKETIQTKFSQVSVSLQQIFNQGRLMTTNMVTQKTTYVTGLFNQLKMKVESTVPGGLRVVEQLKGQPIQEIVGFNKLLNLINQIQTRVVGQLSNKQGVITQELRVRQQNFIQGINDQKPQIPLYDQLPQSMQRHILHKGEQMFMSQVQAKQTEMLKKIDGEINIENVKDVIAQLLPNKELNSASGSAESTFSTFLSGLSNGGIGGLASGGAGGLGGIVNAVGGMFGGGGNGGILGNIANNVFANSNNNNTNNNNNNTSSNNNNNVSSNQGYNTVNTQKNQPQTRQGFGYAMNNHFM